MPEVLPQEAGSFRFERRWIVGLIAGVFLVNLATGSRSPAVWVDEAVYTDPAWNLQLGNGFTSSSWYAQDETEFWAGNVPLYPAMLYVWTAPLGVSVLSVRSLNYVLISAAVWLLWIAAVRLDLVRRPSLRIALIALVLLGFGACFSYRSGRIDALCIFLGIAALAAYSIRRPRIRLATLAGLGILFPTAGLQLVVFAALLCLLLLPWLRRRYFVESVVLGAGCFLGLLGLFAFYQYHGVWDAFVVSTVGTHSATAQPKGPLEQLLQLQVPGGIKDPSFLLMLCSAVILAGWAGVRGRFAWRSPLGFAVASGIGLPLLLYALRGEYPCYYSWMAYIPLCIGTCSALSTLPMPTFHRRVALPLLLGPACLLGLPLVVGLTVWQWHDRDYARVEEFAKQYITPDDYVYCDGAAYYALKTHTSLETGRHHLRGMSPQQKTRLTALVIRPDQLPSVSKAVGGTWVPVSEALLPTRGSRLRSEYFLDAYCMQVFRRADQASPHRISRR